MKRKDYAQREGSGGGVGRGGGKVGGLEEKTRAKHILINK